MEANFKIEEPVGATAVVAIRGEFDLPLATRFRDWFRGVGKSSSNLLIDLSETTFMDSSGLAALVSTWREINESGGSLAVVTVSPVLENILEIRGVSGLFALATTRDEALAILDAAS